MIEMIVPNILSIFIGALVTCLVAHRYYKRAADELRQESSELRRLQDLMLSLMEQQGWATLHRDSSGKIVGVKEWAMVGMRVRVADAPKSDVPSGTPEQNKSAETNPQT
jgi:hypothetical protein